MKVLPSRHSRSRCRTGSESPVEAMLADLADLDPGSGEYRRQRDRVVRRCLRLADHVAFRYDGRGESHEDLVQVARVGLMNAINRFDPQVGSDFVSFAIPTMVGEVRRHFRDNSWSVKVPRRLKELYPRLSEGTSLLSQRLGRAPTATELAAELGLERTEVVEALIARMSQYAVPLEGGDGSDDDAPILGVLGDVDVNLDAIENREVLRPLLAALPERERTVLMLRFFERLSQTQIAERIGVSQTHVSRLLAKSLADLRRAIDGAPQCVAAAAAYSVSASARPAARPEKTQPPRKVPSSAL